MQILVKGHLSGPENRQTPDTRRRTYGHIWSLLREEARRPCDRLAGNNDRHESAPML